MRNLNWKRGAIAVGLAVGTFLLSGAPGAWR